MFLQNYTIDFNKLAMFDSDTKHFIISILNRIMSYSDNSTQTGMSRTKEEEMVAPLITSLTKVGVLVLDPNQSVPRSVFSDSDGTLTVGVV